VTARDEYKARPRDDAGRVLATVGKGMSFAEGYEAPPSYKTQKEAEYDFFLKPGRQQTSSNLAEARKEYETRERDKWGRVIPTLSKGVSFAKGYIAPPSHKTQKESEEEATKMFRQEASRTLDRGREKYEARPRDKNGRVKATTAATFSFARRGSKREKHHAAHLFDVLDVNSDGVITCDELIAGSEKLGMTEAESVDLFELLDTQSQGFLGWADFKQISPKLVQSMAKQITEKEEHVSMFKNMRQSASQVLSRASSSGPSGKKTNNGNFASTTMVTTPKTFKFVAEKRAGRTPASQKSEKASVGTAEINRHDAKRRDELSKILDEESRRFKFRMEVRKRILQEKVAVKKRRPYTSSDVNDTPASQRLDGASANSYPRRSTTDSTTEDATSAARVPTSGPPLQTSPLGVVGSAEGRTTTRAHTPKDIPPQLHSSNNATIDLNGEFSRSVTRVNTPVGMPPQLSTYRLLGVSTGGHEEVRPRTREFSHRGKATSAQPPGPSNTHGDRGIMLRQKIYSAAESPYGVDL